MIGNPWPTGPMTRFAGTGSDLLASPILADFYNVLPFPLLVLDPQHTIVQANSAALQFFGNAQRDEMIGRPVCHFLGCAEAPCQGSPRPNRPDCEECPLGKALSESNRSMTTRIWTSSAETTHNAARRHLRLQSAPLGAADAQWQALAIFDASQEALRMTLESLFLHDVRNALSSSSYLVDMLLEDGLAEAPEILPVLRASLFATIDSVKQQQQLLRLERNEISTTFTRIDGYALLQEIVREYSRHPAVTAKRVLLAGQSPLPLVTDHALLKRALVNLLINALEATASDDAIRVGINDEHGFVRFWVRNQGVIPDAVQNHMFEQYHSTKGRGRSLGTYCVKLLSEHFLQATVGFSSNARDGTEFWIRLPGAPL